MTQMDLQTLPLCSFGPGGSYVVDWQVYGNEVVSTSRLSVAYAGLGGASHHGAAAGGSGGMAAGETPGEAPSDGQLPRIT